MKPICKTPLCEDPNSIGVYSVLLEDPIMSDLTIDSLCEAVRYFLRQIVEHQEQPVDQTKGLVLCGVPGDAEMRMLLELFGGEIKITVRELPEGLRKVTPVDDTGVIDPPINFVWHPERESDNRYHGLPIHITEHLPDTRSRERTADWEPRL